MPIPNAAVVSYVCTISNKIQPLGKKLIISFCSSVQARPLVYQFSKDPELWPEKKVPKLFTVLWTVPRLWPVRQEVVGSLLYSCNRFHQQYLVCDPRKVCSYSRRGCRQSRCCRQCSGVGNGALDCYIHPRRQKSSPNSENTTWTRGDTTAANINLHCEEALEGERKSCRLQSGKNKVVKGFALQTGTNFI